MTYRLQYACLKLAQLALCVATALVVLAMQVPPEDSWISVPADGPVPSVVMTNLPLLLLVPGLAVAWAAVWMASRRLRQQREAS